MEKTVKKNDISYYIGKNVCNDMKFNILTTPWAQDEN